MVDNRAAVVCKREQGAVLGTETWDYAVVEPVSRLVLFQESWQTPPVRIGDIEAFRIQ
jgi:hypothetical protein